MFDQIEKYLTPSLVFFKDFIPKIKDHLMHTHIFVHVLLPKLFDTCETSNLHLAPTLLV